MAFSAEPAALLVLVLLSMRDGWFTANPDAEIIKVVATKNLMLIFYCIGEMYALRRSMKTTNLDSQSFSCEGRSIDDVVIARKANEVVD